MICQGTPPELPALPSRHPPWHQPDQDRGRRRHQRCQLLPRQEGRLRLPRPQRDSWLQDPRHLGQGHPAARQLRCRPCQVLLQSPHQVLWCLRSRHAVPFDDINQNSDGVGSEGGYHLTASVEARPKLVALAGGIQ